MAELKTCEATPTMDIMGNFILLFMVMDIQFHLICTICVD